MNPQMGETDASSEDEAHSQRLELDGRIPLA